MAGTVEVEPPPASAAQEGRDRWVDLLRAGSLAVVVLWHWVFTIVDWQADGPHATNPIGTTRGLWLATWLLQVMPVFFFVGGAVHARALAGGRSRVHFVTHRVRSLAPPALALIAVAAAAFFTVDAAWGAPPWLSRSLVLVLSPLWFIGVYLMLICFAPLAWAAHRRWGELVPVWLAGFAALVDVARFTWEIPYAEWVNWVVVFGAAHQVGFFWDRIAAAPRRFAWLLTWTGLFALVGLTNMNFYPRSTVGVPGEAFSNLGPPTVVIVALACFQIGVTRLVRDRVLSATSTGIVRRGADWITRNAQALFLGHAFAYAVTYVAVTELAGRPGTDTTAMWWLARPFWFLAPALVFAAGWKARRLLAGKRRAAP